MPVDENDPFLLFPAAPAPRDADAARTSPTARAATPSPTNSPTNSPTPNSNQARARQHVEPTFRSKPPTGDAPSSRKSAEGREGFLKLVGEETIQSNQSASDEQSPRLSPPHPTSRGFGAVPRTGRSASLPAHSVHSIRPVRPASPAEDRERITRETVHAASLITGLSAADARVIFATQVQDCLEGGRAAILRPQRREELLALSHRMGFRPFDANLIIALVQDAARRGEVLAHVASAHSSTSEPMHAREPTHVRELIRHDEARAALAMIPGPAGDPSRYQVHVEPDTHLRDRVILVVVLALFMLASLITIMGA